MPPAAGAASAVLVHGEEVFQVEEEARRVVAEWSPDLVSEFGLQAMDSSSLTSTRLRDALLQAPFLDPLRVVSVRGLQARRADGLASALTELPETTRLVISVSGRLAAGSALVKAFKALRGATVREFARLKGRALQDWAGQRARELGLPLNAAPLVLRVTPPDLGVIDSELRKLAAYREAGHQLDPAAYSALLVGGREDDVFRLTDHLLPRPDAEAWRVARGLVRSGQNPTSIAYRLARHLALVLDVRARRDRGQGLAEIQAAISAHPFVVQKAYETAATVRAEDLEKGLGQLLTYEWEVKSGQVDAELGLEGVLARL